MSSRHQPAHPSFLRSLADRIACRPAPLVIYAFSNSEELKRNRTEQPSFLSTTDLDNYFVTVLDKTRSGTIVFNDVFTQLRVPNLPFGGFAESGCMSWLFTLSRLSSKADRLPFHATDGAYSSKASFDTFSHRRGFVNVPPSYVFVLIFNENPADLLCISGRKRLCSPVTGHTQTISTTL